MVKVAPIFILGAGALASASYPPRQTPSNSNDIHTNTSDFSFDQLFQLQKKFLDNFISPANTAQVDRIPLLRLNHVPSLTDRTLQAQSINSSLLAPDVQGRVDITRTFSGQELNTEYLFGLFANLATSSDQFSLLGVPVAYEITHFAASQNIASASTRYNMPYSMPFLRRIS